MLLEMTAKILDFETILDQLEKAIKEYRDNPCAKTKSAVGCYSTVMAVHVASEDMSLEDLLNKREEVKTAQNIIDSMKGN